MGLNEYVNSFLIDARKGQVRPYLELCRIYYKPIFQLIFQLHPDKKHAGEQTVEVFLKGWQNISKIKDDENFIHWIQRIAIIISVYHLKAEHEFIHKKLGAENHTLSDSDIDKLNPLEKEFINLDEKNKIVLTLYSKLKYSLQDIAATMGSSIEAIKNDLYKSLLRIAENTDNSYISNIDKNLFLLLISSEGSIDYGFDFKDKKALEIFLEFKVQLSNLFSGLQIDTALIDDISGALREVAIEKKVSELSRVERKKFLIEQTLEKEKIAAIANASTSKSLELWIPKKEKLTGTIKITFISLLIIALIAAISYYFIDAGKRNIPWKIRKLEGRVSVNSNFQTNELNENETIVSERDAKAILSAKYLGVFAISGNTKIQLNKGFENDNVITLLEGSFKYNTYIKSDLGDNFNSDPNLTIITSLGEIKTNIAEMEIDFAGDDLNVFVTKGWVQLKLKKRNIYLADNYIYKINYNQKLLAPYHAFPKNKFVDVLFESNIPSIKPGTIDDFVNSSSENDLLTLWHLLSITTPVTRAKIVQKMNELIPVLVDDVNTGLMKLDDYHMSFVLGLIRLNMPFNEN